MHIGQKVKVEFEVEVTAVCDSKDIAGREFFCGDVDLGEHETVPGRRKTAYVSGIPMGAVTSPL